MVGDNVLPVYNEALETVDGVGPTAAMPWDTKLDPDTNTRLQQELTLLLQGNITPEEFTSTMNSAIAENAPKYFGSSE